MTVRPGTSVSETEVTVTGGGTIVVLAVAADEVILLEFGQSLWLLRICKKVWC